jgi:hypothetical protein
MRALVKSMQRQENNIKTDLKEEDVKEWIGLIGLMRSSSEHNSINKGEKVLITVATISF